MVENGGTSEAEAESFAQAWAHRTAQTSHTADARKYDVIQPTDPQDKRMVENYT